MQLLKGMQTLLNDFSMYLNQNHYTNEKMINLSYVSKPQEKDNAINNEELFAIIVGDDYEMLMNSIIRLINSIIFEHKDFIFDSG